MSIILHSLVMQNVKKGLYGLEPTSSRGDESVRKFR